MRRTRLALLATTLLAAMVTQISPGAAQEEPDDIRPQSLRGITVPVGFAASVFAQAPIVPTTLAWGPDTAAEGSLLYVGGIAGDPMSCSGCGQVVAISGEGAIHTAAEGLNSVLGIAFGPGDTLWVSDNQNSRGRVSALSDTDGDGVFETRRTALKNIPNGRHQTNGLTFGPDGMLYVANGNATDNGIDCGPPLGPRDLVGLPEPLKSIYEETFRNTECADPEIEPWTGSIIRIDPAWQDVDLLEDVTVDPDAVYAEDGLDDESVLVAEGFRNIYDVDFRPDQPNEIWTPMNGSDNPSGSEPIYGLPVDDEQVVGFTDPPEGEEPQPIYGPVIEDAGFPSCIYDPHENPFPEPTTGHSHEGDPDPDDTTDPDVLAKYGPCPKDSVLRVRDVLDEGHEGTSGLAFERGNNFPARYDGDLFIAEWGSLWNLNGIPVPEIHTANPNGHKIIQLEINEDGTVEGNEREFMTGLLPIDVTFGENGYMYVADMSGQIYEVRHVPELETEDAVTVSIEDGRFDPPVATLVRGQAVTWVNNDTVTHTIRWEAAALLVDQLAGEDAVKDANELEDLNSGPIAPGEEFTMRLDTPGTYHYSSDGGEKVEGESLTRGTIVVTTLER